MQKISRYILNSILIAAAYYISGRLGLLLNIPPGQASAIWPAAGVALAALIVAGKRYFPAIFVGAMGTSLYHYTVIDWQALSIAVPIAGSAAAQAVLGACIINRFVKLPSSLETVGDISRIMFWGGVFACCLNASVGTMIIYHAGFISLNNIVSHWYTWWIGDVFGVLIFSPLLVLLFSKHPQEGAVSLKRKLHVAVPVLTTFLVFATLFWGARDALYNRAHQDFESDTSEISNAFKKDLAIDLNILMAIEGLMYASKTVTSDEFETFADQFFVTTSGITGMSWIPKVTHQKREEFVKSIREQGYPGYEIKRRFDRGVLRKSEERPVYFPLAYTHPYEENRKAHGFDVYGLDAVGKNVRIEALDSARDLDEPRATGRFPIVQKEDQYGFIVYHPVYKAGEHEPSVKWNRDNLAGYVNGIFIFPELMASTRFRAELLEADVILRDLSASKDKQILYDSRTENFKEGPTYTYDLPFLSVASKEIEIAGRLWELQFVKSSMGLEAEYVHELWFIATGGVLFTGLLGLFMLVVTARTETVEKLVDQRTADLLAANVELEEFAYRTSHDLRSPIISSLAILGLLPDMIDGGRTSDVKDGINKVQGSLDKLKNLIDDILQLTEIKNKEESDQILDIETIISESLEKLEHMEGFDRLKIDKLLRCDRDVVTKKVRLTMIIENLLSNAIKYQDAEQSEPFVKIETYSEDGFFVLEISDNGLGIPKNQHENLFKMFKRFHPKVAYGSGLGLHLIKKSADIIGATLEFLPLEKGSLFRLKIPMVEHVTE